MKDKTLNLDSNLSSVFGVDAVKLPSVVYDVEEVETKNLPVVEEGQAFDVDDEFEDIRNSMKRISVIGHDMLEEISAVARESEDHKAYDTAAMVLARVTEVELSRLEAYNKRNKAKGIDTTKKTQSNPTINQTNNTVFVGTTAQLFDQMNEPKDVN